MHSTNTLSFDNNMETRALIRTLAPQTRVPGFKSHFFLPPIIPSSLFLAATWFPTVRSDLWHSTVKHDLSMHARFFLFFLPIDFLLVKVLIGQCYQYAILHLCCFLLPELQWFCWKSSVITVSWSLTCALTVDSTSESKTAGFCSWSTLYVQSLNQPINQSINQVSLITSL